MNSKQIKQMVSKQVKSKQMLELQFNQVNHFNYHQHYEQQSIFSIR